jgi:8-oxo-dGTP pyrophosphatase MutT (NUDIX family)
MNTRGLPSPFYRVTIKALIFDSARRLLVVHTAGGYEMPGGGWEHDESIEACIKREVHEETGLKVLTVGAVTLTYKCYSSQWDQHVVRLIVPATVVKADKSYFIFGEDTDDAKFVTKEEFLTLNFHPDEVLMLQLASKIWPSVEKKTLNR